MVFQPINDIAEICFKKGILHAIISPGSRNAPLTLAFARHPKIQTYVVPDERSAGFIGLGMAIETSGAIVLICTSGTAVLNYGPAIAEAYFQRIPLLVLTADRPPELIDHQDGQTIYQEGVYGRHVKASMNFDADYNAESASGIISNSLQNAINIATNFPQGPVHINIPFREPFYPDARDFTYNSIQLKEPVNQEFNLTESVWEELSLIWSKSQSILVLGRQSNPSVELLQLLDRLSQNIVVAGDIISNLHKLTRTSRNLDSILNSPDLVPDLLITYGKSGISKRLKLLFRKRKPTNHWHIQPAGDAADTYQSITKIIRVFPDDFFKHCINWDTSTDISLNNVWNNSEAAAKNIINRMVDQKGFGEFNAVETILKVLPQETQLHLANSLSVRLANLIGLYDPSVDVYANRGTSGIDGSNSTSMGMAILSEKPVVLITGDMAFFYDRNAFWHNIVTTNLFIIILNNHAGGIFGVIDGPAGQPELEEYFETNQKLTAKYLAREYNLEYYHAASKEELEKHLSQFFIPGNGPGILEITTDLTYNKSVFQTLKEELNKH